jgi:hypothetical protein
MTTSWRFKVLIFSQSVVRLPDTYLLSARFAMTPSRPCRRGFVVLFGVLLRLLARIVAGFLFAHKALIPGAATAISSFHCRCALSDGGSAMLQPG